MRPPYAATSWCANAGEARHSNIWESDSSTLGISMRMLMGNIFAHLYWYHCPASEPQCRCHKILGTPFGKRGPPVSSAARLTRECSLPKSLSFYIENRYIVH